MVSMKVELKSLISKLNPICRKALEGGAERCVRQTNYEVEIEHILQALLDLPDSDLLLILRQYEVDVAALEVELTRAIDAFKRGNPRTPAFSPHVPRLLERAWSISSLRLSESAVRSGALLLAALEDIGIRGTLRESLPSLMGIAPDVLERDLPELLRYSPEGEIRGQPGAAAGDAGTGNPSPGGERRSSSPPPAGAARPDGALAQYTIDLTEQARQGRLAPIRGRDPEIRQIVDILMRRRQNNPILTGAPGVGKTAVVEGFALAIAAGEVPPALETASVLTLDLGLLQAGAGIKGEFEHRLKSVIEEVKTSPNPIILFIDEAHTIIGAGGAEGQGDAANLLKPALARGELRTIAATTWSEYKRYIEKDPALARRFQVIKVEEPDEETAVSMIQGVISQLEGHHGVRILEEAVRDAVELSHRHISGRQLPDKAVSVLDTACARVAIGQSSPPGPVADADRRVEQLEIELRILEREAVSGADQAERRRQLERAVAKARQRSTELTRQWDEERELVREILSVRKQLEGGGFEDPEDGRTQLSSLESALAEIQGEDPLVPLQVDSRVVASVISDWTGIPVGKMVKDEARTVLTLKSRLEARIIGQSEPLEMICRRIGTSSAQLEDPEKPTGVFLLVGPSGVGKTETALTLSDFLYGGERNVITVNMSEYQEAHTVSSLKGAPPGYVGYGRGGVLTEAVRRRPYSLVLLDEIEKAHPDVMELFYQVFDRGMMEDGEGQLIDFKHTLILLTSNIGTEVITRACMNGERPDPERLVELVRPHLLQHFPPAFLGRLTVIPYYVLGDAEIREIVELRLSKIQRRFWERHKAELTYDPAVVDLIAARCTEVDSGARNIDHIISGTMLPDLSTRILDHMAREAPIASIHVLVGEDGGFDYSIATHAPPIPA
jgi:type VI secretion system protein VasG